jgi:dynein heavy chain
MSFREEIEGISKRAEKEFGLEKKVNDMIDVFKGIVIEVLPYKNSGTFILASLQEIEQILEDNFNILMMMINSPYIKPI